MAHESILLQTNRFVLFIQEWMWIYRCSSLILWDPWRAGPAVAMVVERGDGERWGAPHWVMEVRGASLGAAMLELEFQSVKLGWHR
jgi:hypothetical protein